MTAAAFRRLALSLPDAVEKSHMDHPDFRVAGKIFATLGYPDRKFGMIKLPPEHQHEFSHKYPEAFTPVKGAWGRQGSTTVVLAAANATCVKAALEIAWKFASAPPPRERKTGQP
jgi:hypothetical protein